MAHTLTDRDYMDINERLYDLASEVSCRTSDNDERCESFDDILVEIDNNLKLQIACSIYSRNRVQYGGYDTPDDCYGFSTASISSICLVDASSNLIPLEFNKKKLDTEWEYC